MPAYFVLWHPKKWNWTTFKDDVEAVSRGGLKSLRWSCGTNRSIVPGDQIYLLRVGSNRPGIIASGVALSATYQEDHWDGSGKKALYVDMRADALVDPATSPFLPRAELKRAFRSFHWHIQSGGCKVPDDIAADLERLWAARVGLTKPVGTFAADEELEAFEGELRSHFVAHRQRERRLRAAKLDAFRRTHAGQLFCEVPGCPVDFDRTYGRLGSGCAEVHHRHPLSQAQGRTRTRLADLAVICANCHRIVHSSGGSRSLSEVGGLLSVRTGR